MLCSQYTVENNLYGSFELSIHFKLYFFYYISVFIINIVIIFNNISVFNVGIVNISQY